MLLSRIVVKNFRSLKLLDVPLTDSATTIIGENNTGKSNLLHALRLCLDVQLSSSFRALQKDEIHCQVDQSEPFQVLIGVEFTRFQGHENEEALLHGAQIGDDRARIFYRFRPKRNVREALERGDPLDPLTLEHFAWELSCGGDPGLDLTEIEWNDENADFSATQFQLQYLQSYHVVFLPALRDVEANLQQSRGSSLARLIDACAIPPAEQTNLVTAVEAANEQIEASPTIKTIAEAIDAAFKEITGPAFSLGVDLGLSSPSFQAIIRNLLILLSNNLVQQFEPRRNGLGLNNILYIALLIEYFRKRAAGGNAAGELILIEEPEAHLHPQLQATLLDALRSFPFQSIISTHSTQVTAKVPVSSFIMLTTDDEGVTQGTAPVNAAALTAADQQDLNRYLDATKSNLLFARKVLLVEGAAELLLIPPLVRSVMEIDLEREGISVVAIHGRHFGPYARLFSADCLPKKCAIAGDADLEPGAVEPGDDVPVEGNLADLQNDYVQVFLGATTFERELTTDGNLDMLAATAESFGAPQLKNALELQALLGGEVPEALRAQVLRTATRFGKARFAQVAARHVGQANDVPPYIIAAIDWLMAE